MLAVMMRYKRRFLVRQTDLPEIGVSLLGTVEVGNPDAGSMAIEHIGHHAGSTAVADDVNDHLLVLEHPVPVGAAIDACRRLVGADDARTAQSGQDRRDLVVEAGLGATEYGIRCAFADLQGKQMQEQPAQPLIADRMCEAQIDRQRQDVQVNGVPDSKPLGTGARLTWSQHGQCPAYRSTRVTTGRIGGRSTLSYRSSSTRSASISAVRQCHSSAPWPRLSHRGCGPAAGRHPSGPSYPSAGRGRFVFSAWLGFSPFDGDRLELFGVFGGSASFASNSAMRRSGSSSRCHSARINVSFSARLSWLTSGSAGTKSLNRDRRDRVNHRLAAVAVEDDDEPTAIVSITPTEPHLIGARIGRCSHWCITPERMITYAMIAHFNRQSLPSGAMHHRSTSSPQFPTGLHCAMNVDQDQVRHVGCLRLAVGHTRHLKVRGRKGKGLRRWSDPISFVNIASDRSLENRRHKG